MPNDLLRWNPLIIVSNRTLHLSQRLHRTSSEWLCRYRERIRRSLWCIADLHAWSWRVHPVQRIPHKLSGVLRPTNLYIMLCWLLPDSLRRCRWTIHHLYLELLRVWYGRPTWIHLRLCLVQIIKELLYLRGTLRPHFRYKLTRVMYHLRCRLLLKPKDYLHYKSF